MMDGNGIYQYRCLDTYIKTLRYSSGLFKEAIQAKIGKDTRTRKKIYETSREEF